MQSPTSCPSFCTGLNYIQWSNWHRPFWMDPSHSASHVNFSYSRVGLSTTSTKFRRGIWLERLFIAQASAFRWNERHSYFGYYLGFLAFTCIEHGSRVFMVGCSNLSGRSYLGSLSFYLVISCIWRKYSGVILVSLFIRYLGRHFYFRSGISWTKTTIGWWHGPHISNFSIINCSFEIPHFWCSCQKFRTIKIPNETLLTSHIGGRARRSQMMETRHCAAK